MCAIGRAWATTLTTLTAGMVGVVGRYPWVVLAHRIL